jgi:hypothetical protein
MEENRQGRQGPSRAVLPGSSSSIIFQRFLLQEERLLFLLFILRLAIWEQQGRMEGIIFATIYM